MATIKGLIDVYKADLKTKKAELSALEERAAVVEDIRAHAESARYWLRDVQRNLSAVEGIKEAVKGELMDALLSGRDEDVTTNREQYRVLEEERAELEAEHDKLTAIIAANTVDDKKLARLKAALHTFNGPSGDELMKGIRGIVKSDADALKERSRAAESLLPSVDSLALLGALADVTPSYRGQYEEWEKNIEQEEARGTVEGQKARERLDYRVDRILAR